MLETIFANIIHNGEVYQSNMQRRVDKLYSCLKCLNKGFKFEFCFFSIQLGYQNSKLYDPSENWILITTTFVIAGLSKYADTTCPSMLQIAATIGGSTVNNWKVSRLLSLLITL